MGELAVEDREHNKQRPDRIAIQYTTTKCSLDQHRRVRVIGRNFWREMHTLGHIIQLLIQAGIFEIVEARAFPSIHTVWDDGAGSFSGHPYHETGADAFPERHCRQEEEEGYS